MEGTQDGEDGSLKDSVESDEIVEENGEQLQQPVGDTGPALQAQPVDNDYLKGMIYIPWSSAELEVLVAPPTPWLDYSKLGTTLDSHATVITDRVGMGLTWVDQVLTMQNNVMDNFWQLGRQIACGEINVQFRVVFIMVGLDWCLTMQKGMIKEGLK